MLSFTVHTLSSERLSFHYDVTIDEFIVDESRVTMTFQALSNMLIEIEKFIRSVIDLIE
jgi:hypothetical protein